MISRLWVSGSASLLLLCLCLMAHAQIGASHSDPFNDPFNRTNTTTPVYSNHQGTSLQITVLSGSSKKLDRQSLVKLTNQQLQTATWQTTNELSQVAFADLLVGHYDVEVSAVGYLTAHKEVQVASSWIPIHLEMSLQKDPAAVNLGLDDNGGGLPAKARKKAKHGISALQSGNWNEADKQLQEAYKLAPSNPDINFLLGFLYYQKRNYGRATDFLKTATDLNPNNAQALTLLGRVGIQQEDYGRAVSNLEKAILADSDYWVAHDLLAASYLQQRNYEKARNQAQLAIEKGKGNAAASQLVLGQALVNLGQKQEGIQTLKSFVDASPKSPSASQVKALIANLEAQMASGENVETASIIPKIAGVDPMIAAAEPTFSVRPWQPAGIDTNKPSVASGISCPVENVLQSTSSRVQELVNDVSRVAAIEHLLHEQRDEVGQVISKETRTFNYVATVSEPSPGLVSVEEYRTEHLGLADFPDQIASGGFAALALVFHSSMRDNFEMHCEGLGEWRGQATWLVHFQQRDDRPARMHDYRVGGDSYELKLKGRAWITADKFQIVRMESELVNPVPKIRLAGEHQVVEYGPVLFAKKNLQLWLPRSAEIYLDFRRHRYYRKHSFDHYMLFSVDAEEKRKEPSAPAADTTQVPN